MGVLTNSASVRVGHEAYETARRLGQQSGRSITQVVEDALAQASRQDFMRRFNEAYARLKADPTTWEAYRSEQQELDGTLMDGIDPDEDWGFLVDAKPEEITFAEGQGDAAAR
ncbi:MAG: hypothetical protein M3442_19200 [Chloroflexota bacterium]|nr:hypothetical protein [Chloroflexota bacterium]